MSIRDLDVSAIQVLERNVAPVAGMLSNTRGQGEAVREIQGTVIITFAELEKDNEAIILNPDVRAYLRELHNAMPHLFYYLHPEPGFGSVSGFSLTLSTASMCVASRTCPRAGERCWCATTFPSLTPS